MDSHPILSLFSLLLVLPYGENEWDQAALKHSATSVAAAFFVGKSQLSRLDHFLFVDKENGLKPSGLLKGLIEQEVLQPLGVAGVWCMQLGCLS